MVSCGGGHFEHCFDLFPLLLCPDPFQSLPELVGAGGWGVWVQFQCLAELQDLEGKCNRKDRPGHQDQLWMVHAYLRVPWVLMLELWAFLGDSGGVG